MNMVMAKILTSSPPLGMLKNVRIENQKLLTFAFLKQFNQFVYKNVTFCESE